MYSPSVGARVSWDLLTGVPTTRDRYYAQAFLGGLIQPLGAYYSARDSVHYMDDYLSNRGLSYADVKYPSRTVGYSGMSGLGSSVSFVSKNIMRLYR